MNSDAFKDIKIKPWMIVTPIILLLIIVSWSYIAKTINSGVEYETRISTESQSVQGYRSEFVNGFYDLVGIQGRKDAALNTVLIGAIEGRYQGGSTAKPVGGQFISAMVEAYPDLKQLDSYDKILNYVTAGRQTFVSKQDKLLDQVRQYNKWRRGFPRRIVVGMLGYPSGDLKFRVGDKLYTGADALDKMERALTNDVVQGEYDSGTSTSLELPPSELTTKPVETVPADEVVTPAATPSK